MYISLSTISNIVFGVFILLVLAAFVYYLKLQQQVSGKIIAEFFSGTGHREFLMCRKKRELLLDNTGAEIPEEDVLKMSPEQIKASQMVVEIEISSADRKRHPELTQAVYYTRRDCVDDCRWPIGSPIPIRVMARICSWEAASAEPLDPRELHMKLPITSSAGFASGIRENDLLLQGGAMVESMQHFFEDVNAKFASIAKGSLSKKDMNIWAIILIVLVLAAIAVAAMILIKLQKVGI